jgi:hypothetical protein
MITLLLLTLPLFVARVGTNHINNTAAADHLAFIANPFHTRANFHLPDSQFVFENSWFAKTRRFIQPVDFIRSWWPT